MDYTKCENCIQRENWNVREIADLQFWVSSLIRLVVATVTWYAKRIRTQCAFASYSNVNNHMESKALQDSTIVHKNPTQNRGTPGSGVPSDTTFGDASRKNQKI